MLSNQFVLISFYGSKSIQKLEMKYNEVDLSQLQELTLIANLGSTFQLKIQDDSMLLIQGELGTILLDTNESQLLNLFQKMEKKLHEK